MKRPPTRPRPPELQLASPPCRQRLNKPNSQSVPALEPSAAVVVLVRPRRPSLRPDPSSRLARRATPRSRLRSTTSHSHTTRPPSSSTPRSPPTRSTAPPSTCASTTRSTPLRTPRPLLPLKAATRQRPSSAAPPPKSSSATSNSREPVCPPSSRPSRRRPELTLPSRPPADFEEAKRQGAGDDVDKELALLAQQLGDTKVDKPAPPKFSETTKVRPSLRSPLLLVRSLTLDYCTAETCTLSRLAAKVDVALDRASARRSRTSCSLFSSLLDFVRQASRRWLHDGRLVAPPQPVVDRIAGRSSRTADLDDDARACTSTDQLVRGQEAGAHSETGAAASSSTGAECTRRRCPACVR